MSQVESGKGAKVITKNAKSTWSDVSLGLVTADMLRIRRLPASSDPHEAAMFLTNLKRTRALLHLLSIAASLTIAAPTWSATFVVTSTSDNDGACSTNPFQGCSLRQALRAANATTATDTIAFNIAGCGARFINITGATLRITRRVIIDGTTQPQCGAPVPGDRTSMIELRGLGSSVFPGGLVAHGLVLDSGSSGSQIRGLAINGFSGSGIGVISANNVIADNKLGTDATGRLQRQNGQGLGIGNASSDNDVFDNILSGNRDDGAHVLGDNNRFYGNLIGASVDGEELRNGRDGIVTFGANNNQIGIAPGLANVIAFNSGIGVRIGTGDFNSIVGNRISANGGLGIALVGTGANNGQVAPVLQSAIRSFQYIPGPPPRLVTKTTIRGTLANVFGTSFSVDLYANGSCDASGAGEGETFLATAQVASNGAFTVTTSSPSGAFVTAIAHSPDGDSSQFSNCAAVNQ